MLSRRAVIKNLCVTSAYSSLPIRAVFAAPSPRPAICIVDRLLPGSNEMSDRYELRPTTVHIFAGDPGKLWLQTIEPLLRTKPVAISGYTSASTLFCLQYLARDYGLSLSAHASGGVAIDLIASGESDLLDLRDPKYNGRLAAHSWLLAPKRG